MLPILLYIGSIPIASLGAFLVLSFLFAMFLSWRLARAWDFDEEKVLDLLLISSAGAFLGARGYFIITHFSFFAQDLFKMAMVFSYPGFSFWGAFLGGWLALNFAVKKFKLDFWSVADIASVGFLGALIFGNIGCFLSGCGIGIQSSSFFAVKMVGDIGNRVPIQIFEAILLLIVLYNLWSKATHFHVSGKILSLVLIWVGSIKIITEHYREVNQDGLIFAVILIIIGVIVNYKISKKSFSGDLKIAVKTLVRMVLEPRFAKAVLQNTLSSCYNLLAKWVYEKKVSWKWKFRNTLRRLNVRSYPKNT